MSHGSNSVRVNILAIFLFSTILFSSVANTSYESFAITSNTEFENNLDKITNTSVEKIRNAVILSHETGFFTLGTWILGAPFETKQDFL